ncbi:MAG: hypothetical protein QM811_18795 [Pirellulales bacterium]
MRSSEFHPQRFLRRLARRVWRGLKTVRRDPAVAAHRAEHERDLLAWGRRYLPKHFRRPPSAMHLWLAARLDAAHERGRKLNVLAPRSGAKSTLVTLAHVLRAAVAGREPYIWIVSDTRHQAAGHLENLRAELVDNAQTGGGLSRSRRSRAGLATQSTSTAQRRGDRSCSAPGSASAVVVAARSGRR